MKLFLLILVKYFIYVSIPRISCDPGGRFVFGYECVQGKCLKTELKENQSAISLPVCRIFCGESIGTIWPKPTGPVTFKQSVVDIDHAHIQLLFPNNSMQSQFWKANEERFTEILEKKIKDTKFVEHGGRSLILHILTDENDTIISKLSLQTDESYRLQIFLYDEKVEAFIIAKTCFGARHGLETLSQLIVYDDIHRRIKILAEVDIFDQPAYGWRGLLLDTARNFYSTKAIKRTLNGMAMNKLNTFHWHITDSQSFPLELKSQPELFKFGAYSPSKIYTQEDIRDIIEYGRVRGIRVMPEFDAPAHVGEGWQHKNMTTCFNAQPWKDFCVEPPCGQLDPTAKDLYSVLEDIYREMFELFNPDIFHMGGDEVSVSCWNSSESIRNWMLSQQDGWGLEDDDFMRLWGYFQTNALKRVDRVSKTKKPIILWTSRLTDVPYIDNYLNKNRYILQIWTTGSDPKIKEILKRGFRVIISNYDALYFDCGGAGWVTNGNNWCSPYIGWQEVYENNLQRIAGEFSHLVLGAEAAIWSEQIDEFTLDSHFWPRASALAERLWTNPKGNWRQAESRILLHRERLTENGIHAEALQPEWCIQNENECPIDAYH